MNLIIPITVLGGLIILSKSSSSKKIFSLKENTPSPSVALYKSYGVSEVSFIAAKELLSSSPNIKFSILNSSDIRKGKLKDKDVVIFMGGSGSQQGKDLQEKGREEVKNFVKNGGSYIGVCGGSYLALQGESKFNKLNIVAGENLGDYWKRGNGDCELTTNNNKIIITHYENGPVFDRKKVSGISPFKTLATFNCDYYIESQGTLPGQMPGKPAIILSEYGKGKILLFSPNPIIGGDHVYHPELILNGIEWLANNTSIPNNITFDKVFK